MPKRTLLLSGLLLVLMCLTISAAAAQELCETLVREVWQDVEQNCSGMDTLNACYGFNNLEATFTQDVSRNTFSQPSDLVQLPDLHTVHTQPFDAEAEEWGVTNFRIDATAFGGEEGQSVIIFTTGDTIVENAVEPGSDLEPMQAFNFRTAGKSDCKEAPNAVLIQAPKGLKVDLLVNSTPIRIGSTVVLGMEPTDTGLDLMYFTVLEGSLTINPDTSDELVIQQGQYTAAFVSDENGADLDGNVLVDDQFMSVEDAATGDPVTGLDGEPYYRQIPVSFFIDGVPLKTDTNDFTDWNSYLFVLYIPPSLLNYPLVAADDPALAPLFADAPPDLVNPDSADSGQPGSDSFNPPDQPTPDSFATPDIPTPETPFEGQQQQEQGLPPPDSGG